MDTIVIVPKWCIVFVHVHVVALHAMHPLAEPARVLKASEDSYIYVSEPVGSRHTTAMRQNAIQYMARGVNEHCI